MCVVSGKILHLDISTLLHVHVQQWILRLNQTQMLYSDFRAVWTLTCGEKGNGQKQLEMCLKHDEQSKIYLRNKTRERRLFDHQMDSFQSGMSTQVEGGEPVIFALRKNTSPL